MKKTVFLLCVFSFAVSASGEDIISARRDFRREAAENQYDYSYLESRMTDPDAEIARYAITLLAKHHPEKALTAFRKMPIPTDPLRAEALLIAIAAYPERDIADMRRRILAACPDPRLQVYAKVKLPYRMNFSLRNDPSYDHAVSVIEKIQLPLKNWSFITDPADEGYQKNYFAADFNDSDWRRISVGKNWESQGFKDYNGIAWYRLKFKMPPKMKCSGVDIAFSAVDEGAWVWLNGKYVGQHDIGPAGWNVPFYLNIAAELKWGEENLLTVRVKDSTGAGGIWKPVMIEVLQ